VDYDPERISYSQLLTHFWKSHDPSSRSWSRQYMNVIFYENDTQHREAEASRDAVARKTGKTVHTGILPLRTFTMAEDYHQKYLLKHRRDLKSDIMRIYRDHRALVDSTAAARLNGYAGGYGGRDRLAREIDRLGLSERGRQALLKLVEN
jgi:hypothetical protein